MLKLNQTMTKLITSLLLLLSFAQASYMSTEGSIEEYEGKAMFTKDYELALENHLKACRLGSGVACSSVATMYWDGDKTHKPDNLKALKYYKKACVLDNSYACLASGRLSMVTTGTLSELNATIRYFKKGCALGNNEACKFLTKDKTNIVCSGDYASFCNDIGVRLDEAKEHDRAIYFYRQACEHNSGMSCSNLGFMYLNGQSVAQDLKTAKKYFKKSCDLNSSFGCKNLKIVNELYKKQNAPSVYSDKQKTIAPLRDAKLVKNYGIYTNPKNGNETFNYAITLETQGTNAKVHNVLNGMVTFAGRYEGLGKVVIVAKNAPNRPPIAFASGQ